MTEDQMYDDIRKQMRTDVTALEALANTLKKAGTEIKPFFKGENHLYVRCDGIPWESITTIAFLSRSTGLTCRMVALPREIDLERGKETICTPYVNIYKA